MEVSPSIVLLDEEESFAIALSGDLPQTGEPLCCQQHQNNIIAAGTTAIIFNKTEAEIEFDAPVVNICWDKAGHFALVGDAAGTIHLLQHTGHVVLSQKLIPNPSDCQFQCVSIFNTDEHTLMLACLNNGALIGVMQFNNDTENAPKRSMLRSSLPQAMHTVLPYLTSDDASLRVLCLDKEGVATVLCIGTLTQFDVYVHASLNYGVVNATRVLDMCLLANGSAQFALICDNTGAVDVFDLSTCLLVKSFRVASVLQRIVACKLISAGNLWAISVTIAMDSDTTHLRTVCVFSTSDYIFELASCTLPGNVSPVHVGYAGCIGCQVIETRNTKFNILNLNSDNLMSKLHNGILTPTAHHSEAAAVIGACISATADIPLLLQQVVELSADMAVKAVNCLVSNDVCTLHNIKAVVASLLQKYATMPSAMKSVQSLTVIHDAITTALKLVSLRNMSASAAKRLSVKCMTAEVRNLWKNFIAEGDLQIASILSHRHLKHALTVQDHYNVLQSLSDKVSAYDCTSWVKSDILPALSQALNTRKSNAASQIADICGLLIMRAERTTAPQDAVLLSSLTVDIASSFLGSDFDTLSARINETHRLLTIHAAVVLEWGCDIAYAELKEGGVVAAVHRLLWDIEAKELLSYLQNRVSPTLSRFQQSMDAILCDWILDTTASRVFSCDNCNDGADGTVSYDRLAVVTSAIEDAALRARSIMALYQVLTILRSSESNQNLGSICKQLEDMARGVIDKVDSTTREALLEAGKLEKLRDTANAYHITGFDIRDKRQIRSVIGLIIAQVDSPTSVTDALSIADTYSSYSIDITGMLSKALVYRLLCGDEVHTRDTLMLQVIQFIPSRRMVSVFEDAVSSLVSLIEEQRVNYLESRENDEGALIDDASKSMYVQALQGAILLTSIYCDELKSTLAKGGESHTSSLLHVVFLTKLKTLRVLCSDFYLYLQLNDLCDDMLCAAFTKKYAEDRADELTKLDTVLEERMSAATRPLRRLCSALHQPLTSAIHTMMKRALHNGFTDAAIVIASFITSDATTLDATESAEDKASPLSDTDNILQSTRALGGVAARSLAEHSAKGTISSKTILPFTVSSSIVHKALERCAGERIGACMDILYSCDLVLAICNRLDTAVEVETPASMFQVDASSYMRDGILLSARDIIGPLLRHVLFEVQRRQSSTTRSESHLGSEMAEDLEKFVSLLQQSENHLLAVRILLSTWDESTVTSKMVRMSTIALIRKILSYREIDTRLAVALLSSLPYELMVRELKASAPSIQSDFSRLQIIATIGEELARMWEKEELLLIFQSLQTNARWWHLLTEKGVKVDPKTFQGPSTPQRDAVIRAVVPELLENTHGDLALATDYCSQFGIEAHFASRCYMEMQLLLKPTAFSDASWAHHVRTTATTIEETRVLSTLRKILTKMNSLDYEKIRYVCTWLLNALTEQDILDECLADAVNDGSTAEVRLGVAAEAEAYRKYLDLSSFLLSVPLTVNIHTLIPSLAALYAGVAKEYQFRIPLWQLLEDPWGILEPLITAYPEMSARISPLCDLLQLDRDEFTSKRVMAYYSSVRDNSKSANIVLSTLLQDVTDMIAHVRSPAQQINIWRWIFEKEKRLDGEIAHRALEQALVIARGITDDDGDVEAMVYELEEEMIKMKCKVALTKLHWSEDEVATLIPSLHDPMLLIRELLRLCIEKCWKSHIHSISSSTRVLCVHDIYQCIISASALKVVNTFSPLLCQVWRLYNESDGFAAKMKPLETVRLDAISKFLADVESSEGTAAKASGWDSVSWSSGGEMTKLTDAEYRRREDYFQGYAVAVLVSACLDDESKASYVQQLLQLVEGTGPTPTRLVTSRSRFRAAIACSLMSADICTVVEDAPTAEYLIAQSTYLSCLAEMRYLRLTCSDDSLLHAIQGSNITAANPAPLVSTWLRDEGLYSDVCELACDVLLAANWSDMKAWRTLLHHMIQYGHQRSLMHTLIVCRALPFIGFLASPFGGLNVSKEIGSYAIATLDKVEQMLDYLWSRNAQEHASDSITIFSNFGVTSSDEEQVSRAVVLSGPKALAIGKWEDPLEDMTLVVHRLQELLVYATSEFPASIASRLVALSMHKVTSKLHELSADEISVVLELLLALEALAIVSLGGEETHGDCREAMQRLCADIWKHLRHPTLATRTLRFICHVVDAIGHVALDATSHSESADIDLVVAIANTVDECTLPRATVKQILACVSTRINVTSTGDLELLQAWNKLYKLGLC